MARVDYSPAPDVSARGSAPDDYQHVEASPNAFGAQVGQATERLGQTMLDTSKFYGQVAADNGANNTLQQVSNILHGDPSKTVMGPDGQPSPDTGYFGKLGSNAMSAREDTVKAIDQVIQQNREALQTPASQLQYDNDTRRWRAQWLNEIGSHADQQQRTWAVATNNTSMQLALNSVSRAPMDDATIAESTTRARGAAVKNAQLLGEDPQGAILKADQEIAIGRVRSLIVNDPANAQKVFDDNKGILGSLPNYDGMARQVKEAVVNSQLSPAIDKAVTEATAGALHQTGAGTGAPDSGTLTQAFLGQESGNRDNIGVSSAGAHGPGQIMPDTFKLYAKPGERIDNPADNRAVQQRILDDYAKKYDGDPARIAVAYFSGPGNVAPAGSPTPWIHDRTDTNGKSTSSYVADIQSRLAKYPSAADALNANMTTILDKAQKDAEGMWPNYPDAQERYVQGVGRRLERTISQQHQMYEVDAHFIQSAMVGPDAPISEEQLIAKGPQYAQAWHSMQLTNPYGAMAVEKMFDANAHGAALTYGSQFMQYLDRVTAPVNDPNRITSPTGLYPYVGKGDTAILTNTGVNQLSQLMSARGGPEGEAFAAQTRAFVHQMHANLTFTNRATGVYDVKGEAQFSRFMAQALPVLLNAQKGGNLGTVLNPKSPDYLGNLAQTFARTPAQTMDDRLKHAGSVDLPKEPFTVDTLRATLGSLDNDQQRGEALRAAVASHRLSRDVYDAYLGHGQAGPAGAPDLGNVPAAPAMGPGHGAKPQTPDEEWKAEQAFLRERGAQ